MENNKPDNPHIKPTYFVGYSLVSLGRILLFIGRVFGAASVIAGLLSACLGLWVSIISIVVGSLVFVVSTLTGSFLCRLGKKLTTKRAEDLLQQDDRSPVLYLRSFVDDRIAGKAVMGSQQMDVIIKPLALAFTADTEEEVLTGELNRVGPCVAVGIPGERLPPIGAARMYFEDALWEEGVRALMERSELVVMRAGNTHGFLKELEMAVEYLDPRKLIILLPFETERKKLLRADERNNYFEFRELANKILPKDLPQFSGSRMRGSSLSGVIHFQSDWTPKILKLQDVGDTVKEALEAISKRYSNYGVI